MAILDPLPPSLVETLHQFPQPGERNVWFFTVASQAKHVASPAKVTRFLGRVVSCAGWSDRDFTKEITRAVSRAYSKESGSLPKRTVVIRHSSIVPKWPSFDKHLWDQYKATKLFFKLTTKVVSTESILDSLYPKDSLLCLGFDVFSAVTQPREHWRGKESAMQFIVANPMSSLTGKTKDGRNSNRCHDNATRSRIYQVVEFDRGTPHEQAAILSALHSPKTPLVLVVWSGGKSMHGWFDVRNLPEADKKRFFAAACRLGADSTLWDPCKLVRMPGGRRKNGNLQPILHFNPDAC